MDPTSQRKNDADLLIANQSLAVDLRRYPRWGRSKFVANDPSTAGHWIAPVSELGGLSCRAMRL